MELDTLVQVRRLGTCHFRRAQAHGNADARRHRLGIAGRLRNEKPARLDASGSRLAASTTVFRLRRLPSGFADLGDRQLAAQALIDQCPRPSIDADLRLPWRYQALSG